MLKELAFHVQCSSLTPVGVVWSSLRRAAAGEGAETHDLQPADVLGACRRGRVASGRPERLTRTVPASRQQMRDCRTLYYYGAYLQQNLRDSSI